MTENIFDTLMRDPVFECEYRKIDRMLNRDLDWQMLTFRIGIVKYFRMRLFKVNPGRAAKFLHIPHKAFRFIEEYVI